MQDQTNNLQRQIKDIQERNARVEADKAWEVSAFRIGSITVIIYIIAAILLFLMKTRYFLLAALVPSAGYFLSMQSLPAVKKWWFRKFYG